MGRGSGCPGIVMKRILILLLLGAVTAHGALTLTDRGTGSSNSSTASIACSPASTLAAGSTGVLCFAGDNGNGASINIPAKITDSVGNIWYLFTNVKSGSANAAVETGMYVSYLTTQLTSSDNVTITFTAASITAKCYTFTEIAPASGLLALVKNGGSTIANATTGTPTVTTNIIGNADCVVAMGGAQSGDTWAGDADTTLGSWSTQQHTGVGSGASGISITSQYKVVTAGNSSQTYNPTLTSAICDLTYILFTETDPKARAPLSTTNSTASLTINFYKPLAAGSLGVICVAVDNAGTNGASQNLPSSAVDTQGNTWTLQQTGIFDNGTASQGVEIGIYTSVLATALDASSGSPAGDDVVFTFTIANAAAKSSAVWEFTNSTYVTGGVGSGATTGSPSVTTGSITSGDTVIGLCGAETGDTFVSDSDTTNGSWSTRQNAGATNSASGMALTTQYKTVNATGAQTYNPTLTSADTMIGWIEIAPLNVSQNSFLMFFP